jgi:hypothetical protein
MTIYERLFGTPERAAEQLDGIDQIDACDWMRDLHGEALPPEKCVGCLYEYDHYGCGVWIFPDTQGKDHPFFQGCDPGVSFISEYDPNSGTITVLVSNFGDNVWAELDKLRGAFKGQ